MDNYKRSIKLCKSIGLDPSSQDELFLHALEIIGAISCISKQDSILVDGCLNKVVETAKQRIFWKTIQEIATQELDDTKDGHGDPANARSVTKMMLTAFPDEKKRADGRMWLPMHFAVAVPTVELQDIRVIFASEPKLLTTLASISISNGPEDFSVTPCHLAVMAKPPNLALIDLLKMFNPNFGTLVAFNKSTPLHVAAEYSNSVALIRQLIQLYPQALVQRNGYDQIPLCCVSKNSSLEASGILQVLIRAAPDSAKLKYRGFLPICRFLCESVVKVTTETVLIILEAYPDALNILDPNGRLPIQLAALDSHVDILRIITEANPEHLSSTMPTIGSIAHCAAVSGNRSNIHYIYSIMPELFHTFNISSQTPLQLVTERFGSDLIEDVANLVPETATNIDSNGCNLLHTLIANKKAGKNMNNLIRLFLRLIPGGALTLNNKGQTPYDLLKAGKPANDDARRLLLLAGAPSLHPETRKQMNYQARKGALFAFFAGAFAPNIFYRIREGRDGNVLMRQVISFL